MLINIPTSLKNNTTVMAGIYKVVVSGCKVEKSKNSDNMIIKPELTILTQTDANGEKVIGRKLFDNWTVAEQCLGIWNNGYKALTGKGLEEVMGGKSLEMDEFMNRITSDIQAKECLVQINLVFQKPNGTGGYTNCPSDDPEANGKNNIVKYHKIEG